MIRVDGRMRGAHRVLYELEHGPLPSHIVVMHDCDNPPCCRLDHLKAGTHADNQRECAAKGRRAYGKDNGMHTHPESRVRHAGTANGSAKLTDDQVRQIRELSAERMRQRDIAVRFGISQALVSLIVNRKIWNHL